MQSNRKWWIIIAGIIIAFLPIMILRPLTPDNEQRYLVIADEALRNGHWFSFTLNGEPYADKPPFYFWFIMLFRLLIGHHSTLFLSLLSFIPAGIIAYIMDQWVKDKVSLAYRQTALIMLFTTTYFAAGAFDVRMDMLMCMFIVLSLRSFWRLFQSSHTSVKEQWLMGLWTFMALFSKGPLGLLIPLVVSIVFLTTQHKLKTAFHYWTWRP